MYRQTWNQGSKEQLKLRDKENVERVWAQLKIVLEVNGKKHWIEFSADWMELKLKVMVN